MQYIPGNRYNFMNHDDSEELCFEELELEKNVQKMEDEYVRMEKRYVQHIRSLRQKM